MKRTNIMTCLVKTCNISCGILFILFFSSIPLIAQNKGQKRTDSLITAVRSKVADTNKVKALKIMADELRGNETQQALIFGEEALKLAQTLNWKRGEANCLSSIGNIYENLSDLHKSIGYQEKSLKIFEEIHDTPGILKCLNNLGMSYGYLNDYPKALEYLGKSLKINEESGSKHAIADDLLKMGRICDRKSDYPGALEYFERSRNIYEEVGDKHGMADGLNSTGNIYYKGLNYPKALEYSGKALDIAREAGALDLQRDALQTLYLTYEKSGQQQRSYEFYKKYISLRDSVLNEEKLRQMAQARMVFAYGKIKLADSMAVVQEKLKKEHSRRESVRIMKILLIILLCIGLAIILLVVGKRIRLRYTRKLDEKLQKEKERSDNLLLNILPEEIARELKETGKSGAREYNEVSVLFAGFVNFSDISEKFPAQELVAEVNTCFKAFDDILGKYGVEKIKTIGDTYISAGGIPLPDPGSVKKTVQAALEMQEFMINRKRENELKGLAAFEMWVGIHTGLVIAGIVGVNKFQFDIWGNTVNTASLMENSGETGKVNISQSTYEFLKDDPTFVFTHHGKIEEKNKAEQQMYFVDRIG